VLSQSGAATGQIQCGVLTCTTDGDRTPELCSSCDQSVFRKQSSLPSVDVCFSGHRVRMILDSGATFTVISVRLVKRLGLPQVRGSSYRVVFGEGNVVSSDLYTEGQLKIGNSSFFGRFRVLELASSIDAIMGCATMDRLGLSYKIKTRLITLEDGSTLPLHYEPPSATDSLVEVSFTQFNKVLRNAAMGKSKDEMYLVYVSYDQCEPNGIVATGEIADASTVTLGDRFRESILTDYADVFPDELPSSLPPRDRAGVRAEHTVELEPNAVPVKKRDFKRSPAEYAVIKEHIDQMLRDGIIEPSESAWASPVLLVKKADGSWRFVVDYRAVNAVTKKNSYPLPDLNTCFEQLRGAKYFTSLDLRSGYHQIRMAPESIPVTAFTTRYGSFQYRVMSFGLCNAPATFQSVMNSLLRQFTDDFVLVYLDDVLIYSENFEQHQRHVRQVLDVFRKAKFYCKLSKCEFARETIDFVGHTVSFNTVAMQKSKLQALREWEPPRSVVQLQRFLGFCGYYRRFIVGYAKLVSRLSTMASNKFKGKRFVWDADAQNDFECLKKAMLKDPVLMVPDLSGTVPFVLQTDASDDCIAGVLSQQGRIVDYYSRKLQGAELQYPIREKELLAIVCALTRYSHYVGSSVLSVYTDHRSLVHLDTMKLNAPVPQQRRLTRWWINTLSHFNLKIIYLPGQYNIPADALSRRHLDADDVIEFKAVTDGDGDADDVTLMDSGTRIRSRRDAASMVATAAVSATLADDLRTAIVDGYKADDGWSTVYDAHVNNTDGPPLGKLRVRFKRTQLDPTTGLLYYRRGELSGGSSRLVIPSGSVRNKLLAEHHETGYSAHMGYKRMLSELSRRYWWPGVEMDVRRFCRSCDTCQRAKASTQAVRAPLEPLAVPDEPFTHLTMDFVTGLPESSGYDAIFVVMDRLTKFSIISPCRKDITASQTVQLFLDRVYCYFGMPVQIVSDRGPQFVAEFFTEFFRCLGTKLSPSTASHPQTDGLTERYNRVVIEALRSMVDSDLTQWHLKLPLIQFAVNNTAHSTLGHTPQFLYSRRRLLVPTDLLSGRDAIPSNSDVRGVLDDMKTTLRLAADRMASQQETMAERHDSGVSLSSFQPGDLVLVSTDKVISPELRDKFVGKLASKYIGPYPVVRAVTRNAYEIDFPRKMRAHRVVNLEFLRKYHKPDGYGRVYRPPPLWFDDDGDFYTPERIVGKRGKGNSRQYLVRWVGFPPEEDTWEPLKNLSLVPQLIEQYETQPKAIPRRRRRRVHR